MGITDAEKGTCTTIFMLPAIGESYSELIKYGFINAYVNDVMYDMPHGKSIFLLYKPERFDALQSRINHLRLKKMITDDYDYEDGYVVTVHPIPTKWMKDYTLFRQGKYSQFSEEYKSLFPRFNDVEINGIRVNAPTLQKLIFDRSELIKKYWEQRLGFPLSEGAEMWSKPDIYGSETLNIENI